jgi:hypothetical protein
MLARPSSVLIFVFVIGRAARPTRNTYQSWAPLLYGRCLPPWVRITLDSATLTYVHPSPLQPFSVLISLNSYDGGIRIRARNEDLNVPHSTDLGEIFSPDYLNEGMAPYASFPFYEQVCLQRAGGMRMRMGTGPVCLSFHGLRM